MRVLQSSADRTRPSRGISGDRRLFFSCPFRHHTAGTTSRNWNVYYSTLQVGPNGGVGEKAHRTGRGCDFCGDMLYENLVPLGGDLPRSETDKAWLWAEQADLCLSLGSSLTVTPACDYAAWVARKGRPEYSHLAAKASNSPGNTPRGGSSSLGAGTDAASDRVSVAMEKIRRATTTVSIMENVNDRKFRNNANIVNSINDRKLRYNPNSVDTGSAASIAGGSSTGGSMSSARRSAYGASARGELVVVNLQRTPFDEDLAAVRCGVFIDDFMQELVKSINRLEQESEEEREREVERQRVEAERLGLVLAGGIGGGGGEEDQGEEGEDDESAGKGDWGDWW